jgi:hypothetical protein
MLLYENGISLSQDTSSECAQNAVVFLRSAIEEVYQTTNCFQESPSGPDLELLLPLIIYLIYKAAHLLAVHSRLQNLH